MRTTARSPGRDFSSSCAEEAAGNSADNKLPPSTAFPPKPQFKPFSPSKGLSSAAEIILHGDCKNVLAGIKSIHPPLGDTHLACFTLCETRRLLEAVHHVRERLDSAGTENCQLPRGSKCPKFNRLLLGNISFRSFSKSPLSSSALA